MNYNDYPILEEEQYKFLQEKFSESFAFDRKESTFLIYSALQECANACPQLYPKVNKALADCLKQCKGELDKAISNLEATFNLHTNNTEIKETNLFGFLTKISKTLLQINLWQQKEQKEYFKLFALQLSNGLINAMHQILLSLQTCNIQLYKHL